MLTLINQSACPPLARAGFWFKMQVSKKRLKPEIKKQIDELLFQVIADLKTPAEVALFLQEALSRSERDMLAKRLATAYYLNQGKSYGNIKKNLAISSTTIAAIAEQTRKGQGFKMALKKIQAEEWAAKWANRIKRMMGQDRQ